MGDDLNILESGMVKKLAAILFFLITSISAGQTYYVNPASSNGNGTTPERR